MKNGILVTLIWLMFGLAWDTSAATTIDAINKYAYGANIGWLNAEADFNNGAVIGEYVCSGFIYGANVGWISLGDGTPQNGIHYQNNSAADFGVNHDGLGNLRGLAYGANIGWINFETTGTARVNLKTGRLSGSAWSANCGWISLSNAFAHVQTRFLQPAADTDGDGIADAWELSHTNSLARFNSSTDTDGDGVSDLNEYLADTNPLNRNDRLQITFYKTFFSGDNETDVLRWTSKETRCYQIDYRTNLNLGTPQVNATGLVSPDPGSDTTRLLNPGPPLPERYFRVGAIKPLSP